MAPGGEGVVNSAHDFFFSVPFERQGEGIHVLREKEAHLKIIKNLDFDKMW